MSVRSIREIVEATTEQVGAAKLGMLRAIGPARVKEFDPFLLLYVFDYAYPEEYAKGIPWHPHRGLETITYVIRGDLHHVDSLGNKGRIIDGGCQWMTAGSGIMHKEMPRSSVDMPEEEKESILDGTERMYGVQLWLNLPAKNKMAPPRTVDVASKHVPEIVRDGSRIKILSGHYETQAGPFIGEYVRLLFLDVSLDPGRRWVLETVQDANLFVYVLEGAGRFADTEHPVITPHRAVLFQKGDELVARAEDEGLRFLVFSAKSLREPVAWHETIVMNADEELSDAMRELRQGRFIR